MAKLYSGVLSMFGAKAEIAALEKGIAVEVELVPFSLSSLYFEPRHPEVCRINPKRQVPVLVDGEVELFDSTQIFEYFEDLVSKPRLWPGDPKARAHARLMELRSDEVFFPNVVQLFPHIRMRDGEEKAAEALAAIASFYADVERTLSPGEYLVSEFSYADIAFFAAQFWARMVGAPPPASHAALSAWCARIGRRQSVQKVLGRVTGYLQEQGLEAPRL
jgi:glutathione S-transferase